MIKRSRKSKNLKSTSHAYSKNQETELAKQLSGGKTSGSGSGFVKGDVLVGSSIMLEAKCTQKKSYSLKLDNLLDYRDQAYGQSRELVLQLDFINEDTSKKVAGYVLVSDEYLSLIVQLIEGIKSDEKSTHKEL